MTIQYVHGDILASKAQIIVNTVNCMGAMGKGLALQFAQKYPAMNDRYKQACARKELHPGDLWSYDLPDGRTVINVATKGDWHYGSQLKWIDMNLEGIVRAHEKLGIKSIALPKLGCGEGGLQWSDVGPRMVVMLSELDCPVEIHIGKEDRQYQYDDDIPGVLECHSQGDLRFSAFGAKLRCGWLIEELYQRAKRDEHGNPYKGKSKGKPMHNLYINKHVIPCTNELRHEYYTMLWHIYFKENPRLLRYASHFHKFSDKFDGHGGRIYNISSDYPTSLSDRCCQAGAIACLASTENQMVFSSEVQQAVWNYERQYHRN